MNKFQQSEEENEIYVAPKTNVVLKETWQRDLVDNFVPTDRNNGLHVYGDHYIRVNGNMAHVQSAEVAIHIDGKWQIVNQSGFDYQLA